MRDDKKVSECNVDGEMQDKGQGVREQAGNGGECTAARRKRQGQRAAAGGNRFKAKKDRAG